MYDGEKYLILKGQPVNGYVIPDDKITLEDIEALYKDYKYSLPDGVKYKHNYFKALPYEDLSIKSLISGKNRKKAKELLEKTLLIGILNKSLSWIDRSKYTGSLKTTKI